MRMFTLPDSSVLPGVTEVGHSWYSFGNEPDSAGHLYSRLHEAGSHDETEASRWFLAG